MRIVLPLRAWLLGSHLVVLALPVLALFVTGALAQDLRAQTRVDLENQGAVLAELAAREVAHLRAERHGGLAEASTYLSSALGGVKGATLAGIRVVDPEGVVVASSGDGLGEVLASDPEVAAALAGAVGVAVKPRPPQSRTQPLSSSSRRARVRLFVAVPVVLRGELLGAVVLSRTPREELQALYQMAPRLWWGASLALGATLLLAAAWSWRVTASLQGLARAARGIAAGALPDPSDLDRPQQSHIREVAGVSTAVATMAARLGERLSYFSEFAGHVSHEFKTPLSTLRGTIELLRDDDEMPPDQRERFLHNALEDLERMDRMVSGLLALARAEEGLDRAAVSLDAVLREVAGRHGATFEGAAGDVRGHREQLESVADNLVRNAREHGAGAVVVRAFRSPAGAGFSVEDDGPGISAANLPRVFDRFFTTARDRGGTGLGLALVRTVVRAHGGGVEVDSRPGRTVFRVTLPP